ncbi:alpha/beta hydrolase [Shewanella sp. OMA3-2]|uniref:alpha/beta hydrolase n=1 Tax=Shewanella sp. OMA3-2 TaxID=2908650 RepID=UPI001F485E33|nr:alpha/beta hydrolase [Shewanella sp. OMA3-2]UJF22920.1 alpha/beta fold hydrolase [Shewanella sp. OMA3-2]
MKCHQKKMIYYGVESQQFGHLYTPSHSSNTPVVIVVHGGYWKDNHSLETYATYAIVDYLQSFEVAIWNIEYRRMNTEGENSNAPWPTTFKDVADAIDHLRRIQHSESLDLSRVLIIGHSAGGHLATWVASREKIAADSELYYQAPLKIHRAISIAGILDLASVNDVDQPEQIYRLMGGTPYTQPGRYLACNPSLLYHSQMALTVVHGERDTCVNISQVKQFCEQPQTKLRQIILPTADHFSMLPHNGDWSAAQWQKIQQLITDEIQALG